MTLKFNLAITLKCLRFVGLQSESGVFHTIQTSAVNYWNCKMVLLKEDGGGKGDRADTFSSPD